MSDLVDDIVGKLSTFSSSTQIDVLEQVAARLGVEKLIGKCNSDRLSLMRECVRLEEEAWQYGTALSEITALCEGHLARFRIRSFISGDDE